MLFQVYGDGAAYQLLGLVLVFTALVVANEIARRTPILHTAVQSCIQNTYGVFGVFFRIHFNHLTQSSHGLLHVSVNHLYNYIIPLFQLILRTNVLFNRFLIFARSI